MGVDVALRLAPGVPVEPVPDDLDEAHQGPVAEHGLDQLVIDAEQVEKLRQVWRVPVAVEVGLGDSDVAAVEQPRGEAVVADHHRRRRSWLEPAKPNHAAVRQGNIKRATPKSRAKSKREPNQARQVGKLRIQIIRGYRDHVRHTDPLLNLTLRPKVRVNGRVSLDLRRTRARPCGRSREPRLASVPSAAKAEADGWQ